jgi:alginate O-acetyltransferase complex protein AlgI
LLAGPIVRAGEFLPQLDGAPPATRRRVFVGFQLVLLGLTKKLVVADQLAPLTDAVFGWPQEYAPLTVASGVLAYALQIYCDFSGYTDVALGVSHALGIELPPNFALPYLATSLTDFWRRWHMTLSFWLRDYVYVPLGGNRRGRMRTYVNLWITMLVGGLWHGVAWTFVVWGALHAAGLCVHKLWRDRTGGRVRPLGGIGGWVLTFGFVCVAWVFFRAPTLANAGIILAKLCGRRPGGVAWLYSPLPLLAAIALVAHLIAIRAHARGLARGAAAAETYVLLPGGGFVAGFALTAWLLFVIICWGPPSPFIYVQF